MKNIIVASFTDETKAVDAMHKLIELDSFGDISIYDKIMVRKLGNGECEIMKVGGFEGWRTITGMSIGSLLGLMGGPVGVFIGLYTGTAIGTVADLGHYGFADDFVTKTKNNLTAGTVSIIVEIDEANNAFVDISLKPFGAVISRSAVDFEYNQYVTQQIDKMEDDIAEQSAILKKTIGNERMKILNKIVELKEKRKATIAEFEASAQAAGKNIEDLSRATLSKVKSDVTSIVNTISHEVNEERAAWIKRRIARHEVRLKDLEKQLGELTPGLINQD